MRICVLYSRDAAAREVLRIVGVEIVELRDRDGWNAAAGPGALPGQTWNYAWALAASGIESRLAIAEADGSRFVASFFERRFAGTVDVASTPGLSGASLDGSASAIDVWDAHARAAGYVAGYFQLSPFAFESVAGARAHNTLYLVHVPSFAPPRRLRKRLARTTERVPALVTDRTALARTFQALYEPSLRRLDASGFAPETIARFCNDDRAILIGAAFGDEIESVLLVHANATYGEAFFMAQTEAARPWTAWLLCAAIETLRGRAIVWFNLGGGVAPGDGIARFKERFHGRAIPLRSLRSVYDEERFASNCSIAGVRHDDPRFPPYHFAKREAEARRP